MTSGRTWSRVGSATVKPSRVVNDIGAGDIAASAMRACSVSHAKASAKSRRRRRRGRVIAVE